jgi:hypothetical protein
MKVLYLWNTAGVFTPVAEWLLDNGHQAKIVMRYMYDLYRQTQDSRAAHMVNTGRDFYLTGLRQIRRFKPDIIHINSSVKMLILARAIAWRTPIVFTYHGSDARNPTGKPHKEVTQLADYISVTTPDLESYGNYIERPVHPMFHDRGGRRPRTALMFYKSHFYVDNREKAKEWAKDKDIELTILDELHPDFPIPHEEMPGVLSKYEYFIDWKGQKDELFALSKTAIEALACGCKVVHDSNVNHEIQPSDWEDCGATPYIRLYMWLERASRWKTFKRLFHTAKAVILFRRVRRFDMRR